MSFGSSLVLQSCEPCFVRGRGSLNITTTCTLVISYSCFVQKANAQGAKVVKDIWEEEDDDGKVRMATLQTVSPHLSNASHAGGGGGGGGGGPPPNPGGLGRERGGGGGGKGGDPGGGGTFKKKKKR